MTGRHERWCLERADAAPVRLGSNPGAAPYTVRGTYAGGLSLKWRRSSIYRHRTTIVDGWGANMSAGTAGCGL